MGWLGRFFRPVRVDRIPLEISLDIDEQGQHVAQLWRTDAESRTPYPLSPDSFEYGYREIDSDQLVIRCPDTAAYETLIALRSAGAQPQHDGTLTFPANLRLLEHLRKTTQVKESARSEGVRVSPRKYVPTARFDYDPREGLTLQTGYALEGDAVPRPAAEVRAKVRNGFVLTREGFTAVEDAPPAPADEHLASFERRIPPADVPRFIEEELPAIRKHFASSSTEAASRLRLLSKSPLPASSLTVALDITQPGQIRAQLGCTVDGRTRPFGTAQNAGGGPWLQIDDHTWARAPGAVGAVRKGLLALGGHPGKDGEFVIPASRVVALEQLLRDLGTETTEADSYTSFVAALSGFRGDDTFRLPDDLEQRLPDQQIQLRPYQRAGIHWMDWLRRNGLHGVLADDMGLGKTIQTICAMAIAYRETTETPPSLVIAPTSVLRHWEREIRRCAPELKVIRHHGTARRRVVARRRIPAVYVSTYQTVANDLAMFMDAGLFFVVLDEATQIKNPETVRARAIKQIRCQHRLALSGTPVENHPRELWSMFDFLLPGHLGRRGTFQRMFEDQVGQGDKSATQQLGKRIRPFLLRRRKQEVARDLPDKIEIDDWCTLTEEQRILYRQVEQGLIPHRNALKRGEKVSVTTSLLPILTKLKQLCDHPGIVSGNLEPVLGRSEKFDRVVERVRTIVGDGEQVVVFSHFLGTLNLLQRVFEQDRIALMRIDGGTSDRQGQIDRFDAGRARVALCSLRAAGQGINLQTASHVIHINRWWNPAVEDQATDRVHRIGQTSTVYVYRPMIEKTIEERIVVLLERKRGMSDAILNAARRGPTGFTREELLEILRPLDG